MAAGPSSEQSRRRLFLALMLPGACSGTPRMTQGPAVPLPPAPPSAASSLGDRGRGAVLTAAYAFSRTERLHGDPAAAARAVAALEWMAATLPFDPGWIGANPILFGKLALARAEVRAALGLNAETPAHQLAQALGEAAMALDTGDRPTAAAALAPMAITQGAGVLVRLDALPRLPRAGEAATMAEREMMRLAQDDPLS